MKWHTDWTSHSAKGFFNSWHLIGVSWAPSEVIPVHHQELALLRVTQRFLYKEGNIFYYQNYLQKRWINSCQPQSWMTAGLCNPSLLWTLTLRWDNLCLHLYLSHIHVGLAPTPWPCCLCSYSKFYLAWTIPIHREGPTLLIKWIGTVFLNRGTGV